MFRTALSIAFLLAGAAAQASTIAPIAPGDLDARTPVVVLGEVVHAKPTQRGMQEVRVKVVRTLRGEVRHKHIALSIWFEGMKGFDPKLSVGQVGVFFLSEVSADGLAKFAYRGSVAIFAQGQFRTHRN